MNQRQNTGRTGETMAVRYLERKGYKIIERNYRTPAGEIDIIAEDGRTLVFVEVKTRRSLGYGSPKTAITAQKQRKISIAALLYLKKNDRCSAQARFDVVAVRSLDGNPVIDLVKNAFDLAYP